MSTDRRVLVGLGALVAVLAVVLIGLMVSSNGSPRGATAAAPAPVSTATTATAATPAPNASTTMTPAPTTSATPTTAGQPVATDEPVTAAGALLVAPPSPDVRREDAPNDCASLADRGWQNLDCKVLRPGAGGLTYVIEVNPSPSYIATRAYVFREGPDGSEVVILQAEDDNGSRYLASEVEASIAQTGEPQPVLLMGFLSDDGNRQAVDVVRANGTVAAHLDLANGVVTVNPDGLQTWSAASNGTYTHDTLRDAGGSWRVVARETVAADVVPHNDNVLA